MSGFDLLIKNGTLIGGTGKQRFRADIGVTDGKIEDIGELGVEAGERVMDAKGGSYPLASSTTTPTQTGPGHVLRRKYK